MPPPQAEPAPSQALTISADELAGDLPMVCARTGAPDAALTPVWFARSRAWTWLPLAAVVGVAALTTSWAPLASWWAVGAIALPVVTSRGAVGRVPLSSAVRARLANLRRRRQGTVLLALLLTWVSVALWLVGSRAGGVIVLVVVLGLYACAVAMSVGGRLIGVGGRPEPDGGATLTRLHPDFVAAVEIRRTGHRP